MPQEPTFIGVDHGSGDDISAEVEWRILPDGTREIIAMRAWKHEIELTANDPSPTRALGQQTP